MAGIYASLFELQCKTNTAVLKTTETNTLQDKMNVYEKYNQRLRILYSLQSKSTETTTKRKRVYEKWVYGFALYGPLKTVSGN